MFLMFSCSKEERTDIYIHNDVDSLSLEGKAFSNNCITSTPKNSIIIDNVTYQLIGNSNYSSSSSKRFYLYENGNETYNYLNIYFPSSIYINDSARIEDEDESFDNTIYQANISLYFNGDNYKSNVANNATEYIYVNDLNDSTLSFSTCDLNFEHYSNSYYSYETYTYVYDTSVVEVSFKSDFEK